MPNNADSVGKILASSILLRGERDLLRIRESAATSSSGKPAPPAAPVALANDSKTVEALLLTLLDERLQASKDEAMARNIGITGKAVEAADNRDTSARLGARYDDIGGAAPRDAANPYPSIAANPLVLGEAKPSAAPELQSFLQRLAAGAAEKAGGPGASIDRRTGRPQRFLPAAAPVIGAAVTGLMLVWLTAILIGWLLT